MSNKCRIYKAKKLYLDPPHELIIKIKKSTKLCKTEWNLEVGTYVGPLFNTDGKTKIRTYMYLKVGPLLILGGYVGVSLFNDQIDSTAF